ncbi:MAG: SPOR domain-containing protein [Betaproteobacteria bacterium]|nr:SPOR domain-containing protein [Betaproteobacteria bacterium]
MSRDYKTPPKAAKRGTHPMLTGIFIGILIGLGISVAVVVYIHRMPSPFVNRFAHDEAPNVAAPAQPPVPASAPRPPAPSTTKPNFDFYTILPGNGNRPATPPAAGSAPTSSPAPAGTAAMQAPSAGNRYYYLQVGSFRTSAEADSMKAKLAFLGIEAAVQTVQLPDTGVWHRVRLGPYYTQADLNHAKQSLTDNGIPVTVVRMGTGAGGQ